MAVLVVMDFDFDKNPAKNIKIEERKKKIIQGTF
jgi:hypothetical protein